MNVFKSNLCASTDSYKITHPWQFPQGTDAASFYAEPRVDDDVMLSGLHFVARVLEQGITVADVTRANMLFKSHFGRDVFAYDMWMKIATERGGKLPVNMYGVKDGQVIPGRNATMVVETFGPEFSVGGHLETFVLRGHWYPSSVATLSFKIKKLVKKYLKETSDLTGADFDFVLKTRLHDFGARGATCEQAAKLGGLAHLINFIGTDTVEALIMAQDIYNLAHDIAVGISIPAREHSTTICYGDEGLLTPEQEDEAFWNSIRQWGDGVYAIVADSIDYKSAVDRLTTGEFKKEILARGGTCVIRPDSGDMFDNIGYALETIAKNVGFTVNSKGYKVLHGSYRVIQGDGLSSDKDIEACLKFIKELGYSVENVAFGMGGGLLQKCDRDTQKWAYKCSAIRVNGKWRGVRKNPKDAAWKASKAGRMRLIKIDGQYKTVNVLDPQYAQYEHSNEFVTYLMDGVCSHSYTKALFDEARARSDEQA
ncbi:hypothetical protein Aeh1ORF119c [Aeromonas phage Aeh1]|uniref:Nicotinamide phosphoribosyltransferase n=1 Tax=Aeromonas phage Aeh1 TaxID=2880362 RepID=Q76YW5_9CAUD|nr:nicotinamide phosphoribosyl transferase [Aeromonas phage Aeh1]AAQ17781.1 hypothetical protein Aeh1ORF119c [Aeromonas phage Aeh1]